MISKVIYRVFVCHLYLETPREFVDSSKLRNHLQIDHGKSKINRRFTKTEIFFRRHRLESTNWKKKT
jgi:hypothetical protein